MAAQRLPRPIARLHEKPNRNRWGAVFALLSGITLFVVAPVLRADMLPPIEIQSLFQDEQDVRIRVIVPTLNDSTISKVNTIVRVAGSEEHIVAENVSLTAEDAEAAYPGCRRFSWNETMTTYSFCADFPEECLSCENSDGQVCMGFDCDTCVPVGEYFFPGRDPYYMQYHKLDCDTDGEAECVGTCDGDVYDFRDTCVPPGLAQYRLSSDGRLLDTAIIDVIDSQADGCAPEENDDSDTATGIDTENEIPTDEAADSEGDISTDETADSDEDDSAGLFGSDSESGESPSPKRDSQDNDAAAAGENNSGCSVLPAASSPALFQLLIELLQTPSNLP